MSISCRQAAPMTYIQKAFELAEQGFPPLPIVDKRCFIKGWPEVDCYDEEIQAEFDRRWPDADVAIRCTDLCVVDVDIKNGQPGLKTLLEWQGRGLPETTTVRTRSGGLHLYYKYVPNVLNKKFPGVDIKTGNAYVCAPPSKGYSWESKSPIVEAPAWLVEKLTYRPHYEPIQRLESGGKWDVAIKRMRDTGEGARDETAWRYLFAMKQAGASRQDVEAMIQAALEAGLSRKQVFDKIKRLFP